MSQFTFGIFAFTKLNSNECKVGVNKDTSCEEGNGLIEKTYSSVETVIIPAFVKDESTGKIFKVIETNKYCFRNCKNMTSVTLPDTLLTIGYDSFYETSIEELVIPSSVKTLNQACFSHMVKCDSIIFQPGSKIEILPWAAFSNMHKATKIILPPSIKKIDRAFYDAQDLQIIYYCGSYDLSSMNGNWTSEISLTIYVTESYPSNKFAGKSVIIDQENTCFPYLYYNDSNNNKKSSDLYKSNFYLSILCLVCILL